MYGKCYHFVFIANASHKDANEDADGGERNLRQFPLLPKLLLLLRLLLLVLCVCVCFFPYLAFPTAHRVRCCFCCCYCDDAVLLLLCLALSLYRPCLAPPAADFGNFYCRFFCVFCFFSFPFSPFLFYFLPCGMRVATLGATT